MPRRPAVHRMPAFPKGNAPKRADAFYLSREWREFRQAVLARDGYRCTWIEPDGERCSRPGIVVDHPTPRSQGSHDFDPACRSLCRLHDAQRHREKGGAR